MLIDDIHPAQTKVRSRVKLNAWLRLGQGDR